MESHVGRSRVFATVLVAVGLFGPYVLGRARLEQIIVYGLFMALLTSGIRGSSRLRPPLGLAVSAWLFIAGLACLGWLFPPGNTTQYSFGSPIANLDNLLLPIAALMVAVALSKGFVTPELIRVFAGVFVVGMGLNSIVAIGQSQSDALTPWLSPFWAAPEGGLESVATRALTLQRYTGIIGQPVNAGLMYALALILAAYLFRARPAYLLPIHVLLLTGGLLTGSRAFLMLGIPLGTWAVARASGLDFGRFVLAMFGGLVAVLIVLPTVIPDGWFAGSRLLRVFTPSQDGRVQWSSVLGERYGEGNATEPVVQAVLADEPLLGFGLRGLDTATDTAWVQMLVLSGLLGAAAFLVFLAAFLMAVARQRKLLEEPERMLLTGVLVVAVLGSFATPVLTGNRVAVAIWFLLGLLMGSVQRCSDEGAGLRDVSISRRGVEMDALRVGRVPPRREGVRQPLPAATGDTSGTGAGSQSRSYAALQNPPMITPTLSQRDLRFP